MTRCGSKGLGGIHWDGEGGEVAMEGGTPKTPTMTRQRQALMGLPKKALSKPFVRTFFLTWLACDTRCHP